MALLVPLQPAALPECFAAPVFRAHKGPLVRVCEHVVVKVVPSVEAAVAPDHCAAKLRLAVGPHVALQVVRPLV